MSGYFTCELCGSQWDTKDRWGHSCDGGAARIKRLEEVVIALADYLTGGYPARDAILNAVKPLKEGE